MIEIDKIRSAVAVHGYEADYATKDLLTILENDLAESDLFDLQNTWRNDWRAELEATLTNGMATIEVKSKSHDGVAVFGASAGPQRSGQMWLLQSITFAQGAQRLHGSAWPHRAVAMSGSVIKIFNEHYGTMFNFKNRNQIRSIKWLEMCGFQFFERNDVNCEFLFFGSGPMTQALANSPEVWKMYLGDKVPDKEEQLGHSEL